MKKDNSLLILLAALVAAWYFLFRKPGNGTTGRSGGNVPTPGNPLNNQSGVNVFKPAPVGRVGSGGAPGSGSGQGGGSFNVQFDPVEALRAGYGWVASLFGSSHAPSINTPNYNAPGATYGGGGGSVFGDTGSLIFHDPVPTVIAPAGDPDSDEVFAIAASLPPLAGKPKPKRVGRGAYGKPDKN